MQGGRDALQATTVTLQLLNEAGTAVRTTTDTMAPDRFSRSRSADYQVGLATDGLTPGWYLLRLDAALPNGEAQRREVTLRIEAPGEVRD